VSPDSDGMFPLRFNDLKARIVEEGIRAIGKRMAGDSEQLLLLYG
jgi:hypothetical protein